MGSRITICSVGDLMLCDSPLYASVGVGSMYPKIKKKLFAHCESLFRQADITIGNFETVVHKPRNKSLKEQQMCCDETVIRDLKNVGFSVLNLANNHCMQHGVKGFDKTRRSCIKYGIQPIGVKGEQAYIKTVNGVRVAFLSLCIHLEWYEPHRICYENRIARILSMIRELRDKDNRTVIVVSVHWGDEFAVFPSNAQIALAHRMVELGADMILGHHAHVYQGIERYKDGLIVYGQGNFVSDMIPLMCRQTGIVRMVIEHEAGKKKISYNFLPYCIQNDFVPVREKSVWFQRRMQELNRAIKGVNTDQDYWDAIQKHHREAHNDFKTYFKRNIMKYRCSISAQMIVEFIGRKMQRIIGTSTDGRVSSMDEYIYEDLKSAAE